MRRSVILTIALVLASGVAFGERKPLSIAIAPGSWPTLGENVKQVVLSAGNSIYEYCGNMSASPILLEQNNSGMFVCEAHDEQGRVVVGITPTDTHWDWYADQFGHIFCHILAGHMEPFSDPLMGKSDENMWFEESLAEVASAFALARMGLTWKTTPPYYNWASYADWLGACASGRLGEYEKNKPASFPEWFQTNLPAMRLDPCLRAKNNVIAGRLYPLFKEEPAGWEAVCYLRRSQAVPNETFEHYLQRWHDACAANLQPFVKKIQDNLLEAPAPAAATAKPARSSASSASFTPVLDRNTKAEEDAAARSRKLREKFSTDKQPEKKKPRLSQ